MNNPSIFGPVGTQWQVDHYGSGTHLTTYELRKDEPDHRVYKVSAQSRNTTREKAAKGLCIGGPYDGEALTDTDLRIVGMREDYLGFARSDSTLSFQLAADSLLGRIWLHRSYGEKK